MAYKVLVVEDSPTIGQWLKQMLANQVDQGFETVLVETLHSALEQLSFGGIQVVLLDLLLPDSSGLDTFRAVHSHAPNIPVVVLTATGNPSDGLVALSEGAQDYVIKGDFDGRLLARTIRYAIERQGLMLKLQNALAQVKQLSGLLPICASCKKIRDDKGGWHQIEQYVKEHSEADFSHGICPDCMRKLYPEYADKVLERHKKKDK